MGLVGVFSLLSYFRHLLGFILFLAVYLYNHMILLGLFGVHFLLGGRH